MSENPHNDSRQYEDELSFYDLYRILIEKKAILISTIIITLLVATAYLYVVPPIYEAKLRLLLPKPSTLILSMPSHPYTEFDTNTVFQEFKAHLGSMEQWHQFVAANPELFPPEIRISKSHDLLDHPIKFSKDKNYSAEHVDIAFQHEESSASSLILSGYLEFSRNQYVSDLVDQVNARIEIQRENISADIALLRQKARLKREDEIERLRQDLDLAKSLGIEDNLLIQTSSDDSYISSLRDKQIELERLNTLEFFPSRFKPYDQDGDIVNPERPIKPRKALVLVVSLLLGVSLGMLLAFFGNAIQNNRTRQ